MAQIFLGIFSRRTKKGKKILLLRIECCEPNITLMITEAEPAMISVGI
jgi:hypothetical protein